MTEGHEEPACNMYFNWAPLRCTVCNSGYHFRDQCKLARKSASPSRPKNF
jgi:hypothetical protein